MPSSARLLPFLSAPGAAQMALDESMLTQAPALRFYTWNPPALSLGRNQRVLPHWSSLSSLGLDVVRRPTGGRAVLHQADLTYALVLPAAWLSGRRCQIYRQLCTFLIEGLREFGVELSFGCTGRGYIHNPSCFGTATDADLVLNDGRKLIGSAQVWRHGAVLQHGSIQLAPDANLWRYVFGPETPEPLGLVDLLGYSREQLPDLIQQLTESLTGKAERWLGDMPSRASVPSIAASDHGN
ncbi:lipoate--protein ligase family protein [Leptolyngbya sp. FACHB-261]|uniref:lipoate--protein ligase family protein n=1 Tax=Leptolyngbya sp. FACHB-261 TaxID=2692806 RepID=UPI0018F02670|nr:lipoate--protein ligase family protein [Leptolyngbya sp. FACHB-261]